MSLAAAAVENRAVTYFAAVLLIVGGIASFFELGQLEDPEFTVKTAVITTNYPGASPMEVELEVTDRIELALQELKQLDYVTSYSRAGQSTVSVDPESPNQSYAQLIVNVTDYREIDALIQEFEPWLRNNLQDGLISIRKYGVGPSNTWKFEARLSGPAEADPNVLRRLAEQGVSILKANPMTGPVRTDWRERIPLLTAEYSQERGRWASVTREDVARATKRAFDGRSMGLYREGDELLPILIRHVEEERSNVGAIDVIQVQPAMATSSIPLSQVTDGVNLAWEDPIIGRRDRRRTITVEANPVQGITLPTLLESVREDFEAIELPPGYKLEWGGEFEDTVASQASLIPGMIPAAAVILFIIVALFNAYRPPLVILLTIPFALIGIVGGLLAFDVAFGFVALLGAMSLSGMMIKNAVVLLDQVNANLAQGMNDYDAIVEAAVSRLRPVMLAAATTVFGVIPLLQDVFWIGLSVTLMAGLSFGTILTMVVLPVLYAILFRIPAKEVDQTGEMDLRPS